MSRTTLAALFIISLLWALGFGTYAWQVRKAQADMSGMVAYDNCIGKTRNASYCFNVRDDAERVSNSGFPVGNVILVIGVPILLLWGSAWGVSRWRRRSAPVAR